MKLAYILYNERPMSGLLRSQVFPILKEVKRKNKSIRIVLIAFWQPHIMIMNKSKILEMKNELESFNIRLVNYNQNA